MFKKTQLIMGTLSLIPILSIQNVKADLKNQYKQNKTSQISCTRDSADFATKKKFSGTWAQSIIHSSGTVYEDIYYCLVGKRKNILVKFSEVPKPFKYYDSNDYYKHTDRGTILTGKPWRKSISNTGIKLDEKKTKTIVDKDYTGFPTGKTYLLQTQYTVEGNNLIKYKCYLDDNWRCNNPSKSTIAKANKRKTKLYYNLGKKSVNSGNYSEAVNYLNKQLSLYPKDINSNYYLSIAKYDLKKYKESINDAQPFLTYHKNKKTNHPSVGNANYIVGKSSFFLKKYADASNYLTKAIEIKNPKTVSAYIFRAGAKIKLKNYTASDDLTKAYSLGLKNDEDYSSYNYFKGFIQKSILKDYEGACKYWMKSFEKGKLPEEMMKNLEKEIKWYKCGIS